MAKPNVRGTCGTEIGVLAATPMPAGIGECASRRRVLRQPRHRQVDLDCARERGVPVFNAPFSNTRSVAELVIAETILLMRGVPLRNASTHRGGWLKTATGSHEVRGKTLGIVGYGHIGSQVGVLAEAMGMRVLFFDVMTKLPMGNNRACATLAPAPRPTSATFG